MKSRKRVTNRLTLIIVILIIIIFIILDIQNPAFLDVLELKTLDYRFRLRGRRENGKEVAIAIIDEESIKEIGRWPWARDKMARLTDLLSLGGAKVIGFDIIFSEAEESDSLKTIRRLKDKYSAMAKFDQRALEVIREEEVKADTDLAFSKSIERAGVVILPIAFHVSASFEKDERGKKKEGSEGIEASSYLIVKNISGSSIFQPVEAADYLPPLGQFIRSSNSLGHVYTLPDKDGILRWEFLSLKYGDEFYPAFGVQLIKEYLGLKREDLKLIIGEGVEIGEIKIPTDEWGRLLINFNGPAGSFPYYRAADILTGKIKPEEFKDRIVLIGTTIMGVYDHWTTPFPVLMPGVEKHANVIEDILHRDFLYRTEKMKIIDIAFIFVFGAILFFTLPRLGPLGGAAAALILIIGYLIFLQIAFNKSGLWINLLYPSSTILFTYTSITLIRFMTEEKKAREMRGIFSSYVSPKVVAELIKDPDKARLGGERKEVSILFSDVRGFTSFSEKHAPEEVVAILNEYMNAMTEVIFRWDGTLDKFIGDAILVFWGAPIDQPNHAELAVRCALNMRAKLTMLQEKWRGEGREPFNAGIGINTGEVIVGNMGAQGKKMDYTVIGDHVNLGARIESLTRKFDCNILISEFTYNHIKEMVNVDGPDPNQKQDMVRIISKLGHVAMRALESVNVKGRERPVLIYEIKGIKIGEKI